MLTTQEIDTFQSQGYLLIRDFLGDAQIDECRQQALTILDAHKPDQSSIFSSVDQTKTSDAYFLESGDKVRCFFEEGASPEDDLTKSINKIGHALHDLDPVFKSVSYSADLHQMAQQLGILEPSIVQSQLIFKQPRIGGKVMPHQDSTFLYSQPASCTGFWMAFEDATANNGCLMGIPGSHLQGMADYRFVRTERDAVTFEGTAPSWDVSEMITLEAKKGDLIILHGAFVHMSHQNKSPDSRWAYILHMIDAQYEWDKRNWLQRPDKMPFRRMKDMI
jgi:phytanoyl-CoA hydroxylase